ncbi:LOW QUALITY PROTEIN: neurotrimin-like isoform X2 [Vespula maculifrons]|uniref:Neurotrimin-like isoform X2 n=1 Tax=Vespula maculifrons TaxID=7453 RepID=A0ABD2CI86_VESMC
MNATMLNFVLALRVTSTQTNLSLTSIVIISLVQLCIPTSKHRRSFRMSFLRLNFVLAVFGYLNFVLALRVTSTQTNLSLTLIVIISLVQLCIPTSEDRNPDRIGFQPTSMSTYLIFNQLRIIHPQFRPKSRSSVLEPSQNFLSIPPITQSCREQKIQIEYSLGTKQRRGYMPKRPLQIVTQEAIRLFSYFRNFKRKFREWFLVIFLF